MMIVTQQRLVSGSVSAHVKSQYVFVTLVPVTVRGKQLQNNRVPKCDVTKMLFLEYFDFGTGF